MRINSEEQALIALNHIPGMGSKKVIQAVEQHRSAQAAAECYAANIPDSWCSDWEALERADVQLLSYWMDRYPNELRELTDPPSLLYVKGTLDPTTPSLAVVGTRAASIYGKEMAQRFSRELASSGWNVISGLARGIDTAAHQAALETGTTWAVIGSGIASIYPPENHALAQDIAAKGALISEYPMHAKPHRSHFPQRNRLVAALSRGSLVIEAPERSGALLTAKQSHQLGRRLFALPGRVDMPSFAGNHTLIRDAGAELVTNCKQLLDSFESLFSPAPQKKQRAQLSPEETAFLEQMPDIETSADSLALQCNLPVGKIAVLLTSLLIKNKIQEFPGALYKKVI